jgi:hypothetical protein
MCLAWGYDLAMRVSECTLAEKDAEGPPGSVEAAQCRM